VDKDGWQGYIRGYRLMLDIFETASPPFTVILQISTLYD